jgi:selenide,water dikinase
LEHAGDPNLLIGFNLADDAGVYRISDELALIQTLDFLTPMVDDPYCFGQIAAANALSDVYAMGGEPLTAMNIVCYPSCLDVSVMRQIIEGGQSKIHEAGAVLMGGHTVDDNELKYGLAVTGAIRPDRIVSNQGAVPGDYIFITKPLGIGIVATGIKAGMVSSDTVNQAVRWMSTLNRGAKNAMNKVGARAATDITGFGLLGHLSEMAAASRVKVMVWADRLPAIDGVFELASLGLIPAGAYANRDYLKEKVRIDEEIPIYLRDLMFCPETSGGLVIAVNPSRKEEMVNALESENLEAIIIGLVAPGSGEIEVVRGE